jgi:hypothetical protein
MEKYVFFLRNLGETLNNLPLFRHRSPIHVYKSYKLNCFASKYILKHNVF